MSLTDKAETLRVQLGLEPGPVISVINQATTELGLDAELRSMSLVDKADACLSHLGMSGAAGVIPVQPVSVQAMPMGVVVEAVPMAVPQYPTHVAPSPQPPLIKPVPAAPAARQHPEPYERRGRRADGTFDAHEIAGCWACVCIPGGCAIEKKQADGPDVLVHTGVAWVTLLAMLGAGYEDRWRRVHGNVFQKEGADDKIDYSASSCCVCLGPGMSCKILPPCYPKEYRKFSAHELAGTWCCACVPCGWSCVNKEAQGPDRMRHHGTLFWWFVIPIPYDDAFVREGNKNVFHKHDDPNMKAIYFSANWDCGSILGGECRC